MNYAEASYFDGYYFAHIAAYLEQLRLLTVTKRLDITRVRLRKPGNEAQS